MIHGLVPHPGPNPRSDRVDELMRADETGNGSAELSLGEMAEQYLVEERRGVAGGCGC